MLRTIAAVSQRVARAILCVLCGLVQLGSLLAGPSQAVAVPARSAQGVAHSTAHIVIVREVNRAVGRGALPSVESVRRTAAKVGRLYRRWSLGHVKFKVARTITIRVSGRWSSCRAQERDAGSYVAAMERLAHLRLPSGRYDSNVFLSHCATWWTDNAFSEQVEGRGWEPSDLARVLGISSFSFGLSDSYTCQSHGARTSLTGDCTVGYLGDPFTIMGSGGVKSTLSAPELAENGWLASSRIKTFKGRGGRVTLTSPGIAAKGFGAARIKVTHPRESQGDYSDYIWIEVHADPRLGSGSGYGVQVRLGAVYDYVRRAEGLVDATPNSQQSDYKDLVDGALPVGGVLSTTQGVQIKVVSQSGDQAVVRVRYEK